MLSINIIDIFDSFILMLHIFTTFSLVNKKLSLFARSNLMQLSNGSILKK